jgi:hypothetical protein
MLEPLVDARAISGLTEVLIARAVAVEPTIRAERELFVPLARAYFRDRDRALAGAAVPLTTLLLEAARTILDHRIEQRLHGASASWFPDEVRLDRRIGELLTGAGRLPPDRAARLAGAILGAAREPAVAA